MWAQPLDTATTSLYLRNFDNATISDLVLDASKLKIQRYGTGIFMDWDGSTAGRSSGLTISNVSASDRTR